MRQIEQNEMAAKNASSSSWGFFNSEETQKIEVEQSNELPFRFKALENTKSIYLHGSPGSGKTFLMDSFFDLLPVKRKKRMHYNEFMLKIHEDEHRIN